MLPSRQCVRSPAVAQVVEIKKHVFLEHTADVLFEASGDSFEEALEAAADALFETVADTKKVGRSRKVEVEERTGDLGELAVFTLSDLLSEMDAEELFFSEFKVREFAREKEGSYRLKGEAFGSPADPKVGRTVVKGVTHGMLKVEEKNGKWKLRMLLDI